MTTTTTTTPPMTDLERARWAVASLNTFTFNAAVEKVANLDVTPGELRTLADEKAREGKRITGVDFDHVRMRHKVSEGCRALRAAADRIEARTV